MMPGSSSASLRFLLPLAAMAATGNALGDDDDDDEEADERKGNGNLANGRRPRLMLVAAVAASLGKKGERGEFRAQMWTLFGSPPQLWPISSRWAWKSKLKFRPIYVGTGPD